MKNTLLIYFLLLVGVVSAQEMTVGGVVVDENNIPLPGATVFVKGTKNGTSTDFDGKYSIKAYNGDKLEFSYVGYATQIVVVSSETINVTLQPDSSLEEVVVACYSVSKSSGEYSSRKIILRGKGTDVKSGQLTAKELNDLKDWKDWQFTYNEEISSDFKEKWGYNFNNKLNVIVNHLGKRIPNIEVRLYDLQNNLISKSRTNSFGEVMLYRGMSQGNLIQVVVGKNIYGKKIAIEANNVKIKIKENVKLNNDLDIMFTIDSTGSMQDEIDYLKSEIKDIITRVTDKQTTRVGMTFYRDKGDDYLVKEFDFSNNIVQVQKDLSIQNANGGGNYPEALDIAMEKSLNMNWNLEAKSRLMFLLLDAPNHDTKDVIDRIKKQILIANEKGIRLIPIVASGANKDVEYLMRYMALLTDGTYIYITDDSGIGNPHIKPSRENGKVKKLNDLIVEVIKRYS